MHISTTARHCDLDPEVRTHAQQRLEKLSRFARDITEVHLIVTCEKFRYIAEVTLHMRGRELVSREIADDPRMAIDQATDRLEERIRRVKERRTNWRKGDRSRAADGIAPPEPVLEDESGNGIPGSSED